MYLNELNLFEYIMWASFICVIVCCFIAAFRKRVKKPVKRALIGSGLIMFSFALYTQANMALPEDPSHTGLYMGPAYGWQYYPMLFVGIGFAVSALLSINKSSEPKTPSSASRSRGRGKSDMQETAGVDILGGAHN